MALYDPVPTTGLEPAADVSAVDLDRASQLLRISREQAGNLLALAEGLWRLPAGYQYFSMAHYFESLFLTRSLRSRASRVGWSPAECGTSACAVGHAPSLLGRPLLDEEGWYNYSKRILVGERNLVLHGYLFAGRWVLSDNSPRGAALRILRALRRGVPGEREEGDYVDECPPESWLARSSGGRTS